MEQTAAIVEFYGLPGCGKSTLCQLIKERSKNRRITYLYEVYDFYRSKNIIYQILHFPYGVFINVLFLFLISPKLSFSEVNVYKSFLRHVIAYGYLKFCNNYDFVIADHGIIQSVVSLYYRYEQFFNKKTEMILCKILDKLPVDYLIWCEISVDSSVKRIRTRNRNFGRFDIIKDDFILKKALNKENELFIVVNNILRKRFPSKYLTVDTEELPDSILLNLQNLIIS